MSSHTSDENYMHLALVQAKKALGRTSPNPCVGAVIVNKGRIISTGYHKKAGTPHAEIHALTGAGELARGATMYVTLEPCSHTGKTPPCCHAVVAGGISRVVVGMEDPNPLVAGGGAQYLADHGVEVTSGVLEKQCRRINEPFIKHITSGRPLVILKAGISLDGRLNYQKGKSGWITGEKSLAKVHMLRDHYDAILIGRGTAEIDNPSLTTRLADGSGRDPLRVILDTSLTTSPAAKFLNLSSEADTWIFCGKEVAEEKIQRLNTNGVRIVQVDGSGDGGLDLGQVLDILGQNDVTSVLVEGGGKVFSSFLKERLADRACLFHAPLFAGSSGESLTPGLMIEKRSEAIVLEDVAYTRMGGDMLVEGKVAYPLESSDGDI